MLPTSNRVTFRSLHCDLEYRYALTSDEEGTIKFHAGSSYLDRLTEWVDSVSKDKRGRHQAVACKILQSRSLGNFFFSVPIDCRGLDTFPPLPNRTKNRDKSSLSLILVGQPNVTLEAFLAHLPDNVVELVFVRNTAIQTFSSGMVSAFTRKLTISNCPNFADFTGEFSISTLNLEQSAGRSLTFLEDNFPRLRYLCLFNNSNLESIEVSENFELRQLDIRGDHNKLIAIPPFFGLEKIDVDASGLASISDYSWGYDATKGFQYYESSVIDLVKNHHQQGRPAATLKLIEMTEYILTTGKTVSKKFATRCLEGLIGMRAASCGPAELLLGKLFLDEKLIDSDYQRAQKWFQLAVDREKDPAKKEALEQTIELLERKYFQDFYQKVQLFSHSEEETNFPLELSQYIFSMGLAAMKEPR